MAWVLLIAAGVFECGFAVSLKESDGFSRLVPSVLFALCGAASFWLLSRALRELPVGTAYAVWTGIGAAATVVIGMVFLDEPVQAARLVSIGLIIAGVAGLQLAGGAGH